MSHSKIFRGLALFTAVTFFFFPVNLSATTALVGDARNQYQAEKKAELTLFTVSLDKPQSMQASGTNLLITVDSDSKATVDFFAASGEKVQTWSGLYM